jgi:hypothetical protein
MTARSIRGDEGGLASSMIAFLIAGVLFVAAIGAVLYVSRQGPTGASASTVPQANLRVQAEGLSEFLVGSSGFSVTGGVQEDWMEGGADPDGKNPHADSLTRLGLRDAEAADPLLMNFSKFQNLRRAPYAQATDGYVNYPEARKAFGLDDAGLDFHIRAYPTLPEVAELLRTGYRDPNLRVAYIGNISEDNGGGGGGPPPDPGEGLELGAITCTTHADAPRAYRIQATVKNGGTATTQFEAIWDIRMAQGNAEYHKKNTWTVAAGATVTVFADVANTSGRTCAGADANLKVYDNTNLLNETEDLNLVQPSPAPSSAARGLVLETSRQSYLPTEAVGIAYSGKNLKKDDKLILTVCPGATECRLGSDTTGHIVQITVPLKDKDRVYNFTAGAIAAGEHTIRLYDNPDGDAPIETTEMRASNLLVIANPEPGPYVPQNPAPPPGAGDYVAGPDAQVEVEYLHNLVQKFCPSWFDTGAESPMTGWGTAPLTWGERCEGDQGAAGFKAGQPHPGDVYPQLKKTLKEELAERLMVPDGTGNACSGTPRYDWTNVLIVGSNVDHNVMTSGDVKQCIETWVLGGGTLIVLGSVDMNTHWLESVFHTALESSSGGLSVPDAGHPVLHVADDLDYSSYQHERAWRLKTTGSFDAEAAFTRVANDAASGDAILAVGDPGAFRNGNVILTGWTPYDLRGNGPGIDRTEGLMLTNNLLMLGYRDLFLDYGPPLPENANVQPAVSKVHIEHPQFADPILLDISVYVFPGG